MFIFCVLNKKVLVALVLCNGLISGGILVHFVVKLLQFTTFLCHSICKVWIKDIMFIFIFLMLYYPSDWKVSLVTMIPMLGKYHTKVESYRPICLYTYIKQKIFEKLLINNLMPILSRFDCIPTHQFEFKESTIEQTQSFVNVMFFRSMTSHTLNKRCSRIIWCR